MSNYGKYLQASFLPLRLPVAEALWSIEKHCPGKVRHTLLQKEWLQAHSIGAGSVYGFCVQTTKNYACEGLFENSFFGFPNKLLKINSGLSNIWGDGTHYAS